MILDVIAAAAKERVAAAKASVPIAQLKEKAFEIPQGSFCFESAIRTPDISFICEIKKASPSKGPIVRDFLPVDIAREYEQAGASCISVLTEPRFFGGGDNHLKAVRAQTNIPLLRKDFVVDEYQLYEAKALGADAVLLICALMDEAEMRRYLTVCDALGLSALVEAHTAAEVETAKKAGARIIGINNRNLKTFSVDLTTCARLRPLVPQNLLFVAESGIKTADDVAFVRSAGADAVLIGEALMTSPDKKAMLRELQKGGAP